MKCQNINFPALTFTSPGVYTYTVRELTPSDAEWETDGRVYRAVVTVTENDDGNLEAHVDYPDGFPEFVNGYACPPPEDVCKYFNNLPFPMFWFVPPQKPEFERYMGPTRNILHQWDAMTHGKR
ncbi:MAG: hypothetical protein FWE90_04920 [Defluviitaleaceae bacterium]|nr:hypothetical protein [Defluviitaleaceae bacterium]